MIITIDNENYDDNNDYDYDYGNDNYYGYDYDNDHRLTSRAEGEISPLTSWR